MSTIWVLLPAYEEAENLPALLTDWAEMLRGWPEGPYTRVIVVDDGSTDGTGQAARTVEGIDVTVLTHERNQGLGAAMRTGMDFVLENAGANDFLISMDADHTHPPELVPAMWQRAQDGADLVIASRFQPGASVHGLGPLRRGISRVASLVLQLLFPGARDYTCGFRLYRLDLLRWGRRRYGAAFLNQAGFSVMVDLLLKLRRRARRIDEVPLTLRYDRKKGASKMRLLATSWTTLRLIGRRYRGDPHGP